MRSGVNIEALGADNVAPRVMQLVADHDDRPHLPLVSMMRCRLLSDILAWRSQETNVKVRELASEFMAAISASHLSPESRGHVDHTLLTLG